MNDLLLVLAGGGIAAAVLKFIEFLISHIRHNKEYEDNVDNKIEDTKRYLKQHLVDVNAEWKEMYCDKNAQAIQDLVGISKELKDNVILLTGAIAEMKEYNQTVGAAVNGIIHDRLIHNVDNYISRKGITIEELSTLKSMYYPYKKLGGNGDVETAFEQATKLPVITKEEATKLDEELNKKI